VHEAVSDEVEIDMAVAVLIAAGTVTGGVTDEDKAVGGEADEVAVADVAEVRGAAGGTYEIAASLSKAMSGHSPRRISSMKSL
jgi:hypothetical protein